MKKTVTTIIWIIFTISLYCDEIKLDWNGIVEYSKDSKIIGWDIIESKTICKNIVKDPNFVRVGRHTLFYGGCVRLKKDMDVIDVFDFDSEQFKKNTEKLSMKERSELVDEVNRNVKKIGSLKKGTVVLLMEYIESSSHQTSYYTSLRLFSIITPWDFKKAKKYGKLFDGKTAWLYTYWEGEKYDLKYTHEIAGISTFINDYFEKVEE